MNSTEVPIQHTAGRLATLPAWTTGVPGIAAHHAEVLANSARGDRYWQLRLRAPDIAAVARPGQFVMLTAASGARLHPVLPRPMALYDWDIRAGWIDVVYGVVGEGSALLTEFRAGTAMTVVGPLGRGFDLDPAASSVLLIGRGIGVCSLTALAGQAARSGVETTVVLSARSRAALAGSEVLARHGIRDVITVLDSDGSSTPERLTARLLDRFDTAPPAQIFTCGSERLTDLCARLATRWRADLQVSLEARMACGLGYCHGCSSGRGGSGVEDPLVCADGPVFRWTA
ncbi:dihydroorotate dehydrogenase electron transfer subunit [Nocardia sp. JMUB6875]|uniref:iron-sulfur cluster-binding protein n=1 Tax=Nocardia sp. JMUB6875 TaxID=3158170 RepID=UPI0032E6AA0F